MLLRLLINLVITVIFEALVLNIMDRVPSKANRENAPVTTKNCARRTREDSFFV